MDESAVSRRPLDGGRIDWRLTRIRELLGRWDALRRGDGQAWRKAAAAGEASAELVDRMCAPWAAVDRVGEAFGLPAAPTEPAGPTGTPPSATADASSTSATPLLRPYRTTKDIHEHHDGHRRPDPADPARRGAPRHRTRLPRRPR
ncbi:hypothetical protein [Streptomyces sp. JV178]|uniref:hypothetical protein n=1 Tax=Streptomyces sp. JV178 TaxID=858632 RepID=UPI00117F9A71|nr:hypothetical protein [Streptomyces sp. JV178]